MSNVQVKDTVDYRSNDDFKVGNKVKWTEETCHEHSDAPTTCGPETIKGTVAPDVDNRCGGGQQLAVKRDTYTPENQRDPHKYECVLKGEVRRN